MKSIHLCLSVLFSATITSSFIVEFLGKVARNGLITPLPPTFKKSLLANCGPDDMEDVQELNHSYQSCLSGHLDDKFTSPNQQSAEKLILQLCEKIPDIERCHKLLTNTDFGGSTCFQGITLYQTLIFSELQLLCQNQGQLLIDFAVNGSSCWGQRRKGIGTCVQVLAPLAGNPPFDSQNCKVWDVLVQCISNKIKSCPPSTKIFFDKVSDLALKASCKNDKSGPLILTKILEILSVNFISDEAVTYTLEVGVGAVQTVQESITTFQKCALEHSVISVLQASDTQEIVPRMCTNLPNYRECFNSLISSLRYLTDDSGASDLDVVQSAILEVFELICSNSGERIVDLGMAGVDCFMSNRERFDFCHQSYNVLIGANSSGSSIFSPQRCQLNWNVADCLMEVLQTCSTSGPAEFFKDMFDVWWEKIPCKFSSMERSRITASVDGIADALVKMTTDTIIPPSVQEGFDGKCADEYEMDRVEYLKKSRVKFRACVRFEISRAFDSIISTTEEAISSLCNKVSYFDDCLNPLVTAMKNCTNRVAGRDIEIGKSAFLHGLKYACQNGGERLLEFGNHPPQCGESAKKRAKTCSKKYVDSIMEEWEQHSIYDPDHCENHINLMKCSTDLMTKCLGRTAARNFEEILNVMLESTPCGGAL